MTVYYNNTRNNKGYPVGTIIPWTGDQGSIPKGWVACNGGTLRKDRHPLLFKTIGITYGGTQTSTSFNVPNINNGGSGIMDMAKFMHQYLNRLANPQDFPDPLPGRNDMHTPDTEIYSDDIFWQDVQEGDNGNKPGSAQTNYNSTIDVVGQLNRTNNLTAIYDSINLNPGELFTTLFLAQRKLSDVHLPSHGHSLLFNAESEERVIVPTLLVENNRDRLADECVKPKVGFLDACKIGFINGGTCSKANRPIPGTTKATNSAAQGPGLLYIGNEKGMDELNGKWRCTRGGPGQCGNGYYGGSLLTARDTGQTTELGRGPSYDGDGQIGGDMWAYREGTSGVKKYTFTNLNPPKTAEKFSSVAAHTHGFLGYTFSSRFYRIITPGLVQDVDTADIQVNNSTGVNFGTITVNTATPTLSMIYIIKAS